MGEYSVKLGLNAYERDYSGEPIIRLENRFIEKSGVNQIEGRIALARPPTALLTSVGTGPIRLCWSQPDVFDGDLIVVSGQQVYRVAADGTITHITGAILGTGDVSAAVVSDGATRRLYFADNLLLQYYDGGTGATGTLTASTPLTPDVYAQTLQIGGLYYAWAGVNVAASAHFSLSAIPAGNETVTLGATVYRFVAAPAVPNDVKIGATAADSLTNLVAAILATPSGAGSLYGTGTVANASATAVLTGGVVLAVSKVTTLDANFITSTTTCANGAWDRARLLGAGDITRRATALATFTGQPSAGDTITVGSVTYTFRAALTHAGTEVLIGSALAVTLDNLAAAINLTAGNGSAYTASAANADATAQVFGSTFLVEATAVDAAGNAVAVSAASAVVTWSDATLTRAQDGSQATPLLAKIGTDSQSSLFNMTKLLDFAGTPGVDFSIAVNSPDPHVSATSDADSLSLLVRSGSGVGVTLAVLPATDPALAWDAADLTSGSAKLLLTPSDSLTNSVIQIGTTYYGWGNITTANQAGTQANPFLTTVGASVGASLTQMAKLINFTGIIGTDYSSDVGGPNTQVSAAVVNDSNGNPTNQLVVTARDQTVNGNTIATVVVTGGAVSWGAGTLHSGGVHTLVGVEVPDGLSAISVASCAGFLLVACGNSQKFFWIAPGETTIDPLNFANAEFAADNLLEILAVADQVWLLGESSIEVWYPNTQATDLTQAFQPVAGRSFATGIIPSTAVKIRDTVVFVGHNGVVYAAGGNHIFYTAGGQMQRISTHAIEETIRKHLQVAP